MLHIIKQLSNNFIYIINNNFLDNVSGWLNGALNSETNNETKKDDKISQNTRNSIDEDNNGFITQEELDNNDKVTEKIRDIIQDSIEYYWTESDDENGEEAKVETNIALSQITQLVETQSKETNTLLTQKETEVKPIQIETEKELQWLSQEAKIVVDNLSVINDFQDTYNEIYWDEWLTISGHAGLVWIIRNFGDSDLERFIDKLNIKYENLDIDNFKNKLWIEDESNKYNIWLKRVVAMSILSAVLSWGTTIALELLWVNYDEKFGESDITKENIIKLLTWKEYNHKESMSNLFSKEKNTENQNQRNTDVSAILDVLNNNSMDTANLNRIIQELFNYNIFDKFFNTEYKDMKQLVEKFETTNNIEESVNIINELYDLVKEKIEEKWLNQEEYWENWEDDTTIDKEIQSLKKLLIDMWEVHTRINNLWKYSKGEQNTNIAKLDVTNVIAKSLPISIYSINNSISSKTGSAGVSWIGSGGMGWNR